MLYNVDSTNALVQILGTFTKNTSTNQWQPAGGLIFFLTPPRGIIGSGGIIPTGVGNPPNYNIKNFAGLTQSIPRAIVYGTAMIILSIFFSRMWIETAGMGPKDVSQQLLDAGMQIPGWRRSKKTIEKRLEMYIPAAALLGGLFIGILAAFADFLGALGTGTGILLSVSIMRQYFDILIKERAAEMHPAIRDFLGII